MRYLLNKDTFSYVAKTATQVIRELAEDFELKVGDLDDTQYVISKHRDPDATILDMCQTALDLTLMQTGKIYVIYDDCGKLNLKEISKLKTDLYFDGETAGNYDYTGSIDKETANLIKLDLDNGQEGHQVVYAPANSTAYQQSATRKQWGVLQYYESEPFRDDFKPPSPGQQAVGNEEPCTAYLQTERPGRRPEHPRRFHGMAECEHRR